MLIWAGVAAVAVARAAATGGGGAARPSGTHPRHACVQHPVPWQSTCPDRFREWWVYHEGVRLEALGETCADPGNRSTCKPMQAQARRAEMEARKLTALKHLLGFIARPWEQAARLIYIDLGSRVYMWSPSKRHQTGEAVRRWPRGSIAKFQWTYPRGPQFQVVAFEANPIFNSTYEGTSVEYYNYAAGTTNATALLTGNGLGARVFANGTHMQQSGHISRVRVLDFPSFLRRRVRASDFVVLKMDIEDSEWKLLPALLDQDVVGLVDEIFLECHHRETWTIPTTHTWEDCMTMFRRLRDAGVWAHEWF